MTTGDDNRPSTAQESTVAHSDDEHSADETTPLMHDSNVHNANAAEEIHDTPQDQERAHWANVWKWTKRDIGYAALFSVPILLFVPSLVFLVMTLNLRATLPPSSSLETITNLTHRVSQLSKSLNNCQENTTHLTIMLNDEQQRVEVCRESEKRLAARVEVVEDMLDKCQLDGGVLKKRLDSVQGELGICVDEREELKRQMESGVFVQFIDMIGKMGTGGDSWVCSDETPLWSHGYASNESPHPTITIQTWTSDLDDAQHSTAPLVFPPLVLNSDPPPPTSFFASQKIPSNRFGRYQQQKMTSEETPAATELPQTDGQSIRIIGYSVTSQNLSGNNGWWRIAELPAFAVEGGKIEFFAQAAKWYGSKAKFEVTVYWVGTSKDEVAPEDGE